MELNPEQVEAWVQIAQLTQLRHGNPKAQAQALRAYEKAAAALRRARRPEPPELYSNVGVLRQQLGDAAGAESALRSALRLSYRKRCDALVAEAKKARGGGGGGDEEEDDMEVEVDLPDEAEDMFRAENSTVAYNLARASPSAQQQRRTRAFEFYKKIVAFLLREKVSFEHSETRSPKNSRPI